MMTASGNQRTKNDQMVEQLNRILADTYVLYVKTQNFHWNITDARFYALHKFLEEQYQELAEATDLIAEHIRSLNAPAPGSMQQFLALKTLEEDTNIQDGDVILLKLYRDHKTLAASIQQSILFADEHKDAATSDMLVGRLRAHNKVAWMLRSHLGQGDIVEL
jgi:starvation-inducible DNA-binding protein